MQKTKEHGVTNEGVHMKTNGYEVQADKLRWQCDPKLFKFECTKDLAPLKEFIGQERAIRALEFGLGMVSDSYNIFMAGLTGTGKTSMVKTYIQRLIKDREATGESLLVLSIEKAIIK